MSYLLKTDKSGKFMFNLKAGNGEVILTSEAYSSKASALNGIESVRTNGSDESNFEIKDATSGKPYFVLKASNGQVVGRSQMYSSEASAKNGIASVQKNCASTEIKEEA